MLGCNENLSNVYSPNFSIKILLISFTLRKQRLRNGLEREDEAGYQRPSHFIRCRAWKQSGQRYTSRNLFQLNPFLVGISDVERPIDSSLICPRLEYTFFFEFLFQIARHVWKTYAMSQIKISGRRMEISNAPVRVHTQLMWPRDCIN